MGGFPDSYHCLRFRSVSSQFETISHYLCKFVLGHGPVYRVRTSLWLSFIILRTNSHNYRSGVLRGAQQRTDEWAYRIPFAIQWFWPIPILIGCFFAPESPWWEVRKGNHEGARRSLRRLTSKEGSDAYVEETLAMIVHTDELEKSLSKSTSYLDCFKGTDLRRTEIVCGVWLVQTLCGANVMGYSTYFMKQAGLPVDQSYSMTLGGYALGVVGTVLSWFLISRAGRRTIYLCGVATLFTLLLIVGFLGIPTGNKSAVWALSVLLLIFTFIYDFSVGPICYSLVAELS